MTDRKNRRRRHKRHKARTARGPFRSQTGQPITLLDSVRMSTDSSVLKWRFGKFPTAWDRHHRVSALASVFSESNPFIDMFPMKAVAL